MTEIADPSGFLRSLFDAALDAARPALCVPPHLPPPPKGRTIVIGAGKAAASMAEAVEAHWPADAPLSGLVVTRYAHGGQCRRIEVVEAGHPMPDANGYAAAARILEMVKGLSADDLVLCLVSGGGSALLHASAAGSAARGQTSGDQGLAARRRRERRDQLRAQASLRRQGRAPGAGGSAGENQNVDYLRRARR